MNKKYKVNNVFNEDEPTFNALICKIFTTFLDEELNLFETNNIVNSNVVLEKS